MRGKIVMKRITKSKKTIIVVCIIIFVILLVFLKMKYGTYGRYDFQRFFNQTKQEALEENGKPNSREPLAGNGEEIKFDGVDYTFGPKYPDSARITDPNIRFGILKIGGDRQGGKLCWHMD